jgi:hypothetical protein
MSEWWLAYLGIGAIVGFLAGLLGVGGGAIMVPLLVAVYAAQGLPAEQTLRFALGTSMATIFFTSLSSTRAHHLRGAVDWRVVRAMSPGILFGSFAAALIAGLLPARWLAFIFAGLVTYVAISMFFDLRPRRTRELPGAGGLFAAGSVIGAASSLFAAGGAFGVPVDPFPDVVQRPVADGIRNCRCERISDCIGRHCRVCAARLAGRRPAARGPGLRLSAGPGLDRSHQHANCAPRDAHCLSIAGEAAPHDLCRDDVRSRVAHAGEALVAQSS